MNRPLYFLPRQTADLAGSRWNLYLVGAGGTGSWILRNLARLCLSPQLATERIASVTVIDDDVVEPRNVGRQDFHAQEVGLPKAEALTRRYNRYWGTAFRCVPQRLKASDIGKGKLIPPGSLNEPTLIIGAVDSGASRQAIHNAVLKASNRGARRAIYWLDSGNSEHSGQIVWGNSHSSDDIGALESAIACEYLPYPTLLFPELLEDEPEPEPGCVEMAPNPQSLLINSFMGTLAVQMLAQMLEGELNTHYISVDLHGFQMSRQVLTQAWLASMADLVQELALQRSKTTAKK